ncbi:hemocyte protein-glutamine gamma-glutamyltransferase [Hyalella azteca]|uniref:protein-glutamine gamma-glutamyltransferase n=1 Tax=Hyalella azteca TaxID=294128 RepID=A0A8B7PFS5_HYAAZ|nr:hemocyte protein-glutamine gamma-glutamyltransferase [Hyalella azteca]
MSATRYGTGYNNWVNGLRATYSRELNRRIAEEKEAEQPEVTEINRVDRIHFYIKDNATQHNTIKFDQVHDVNSPKPVLRRGQTFYLAIRFKERNIDFEQDRVILNFVFGPRPSVTKGTMAVIAVENRSFTKSKNDWDVRIDPGTRGKDLVLQVYVPASVPVGIWRLNVRTGLHDRSLNKNTVLHSQDTDIFILFNPWCKDDSVYLEDDAQRHEYVINDRGKVYVGQYRQARGRPWAFGQFDDAVLPVAVYLLEMPAANLAHSERGNPVQVVRAISAGVNDSNDDGILQGNWSTDYTGGTPPFKWTGSVRILEEYIKQGYRPVKYGQCWVFSAVATTICRALGIPCRSVTNFVSAHDTNSSLTVDKFFTKSGDEIEGGPDGDSFDSIWNFHVWNEVWMTRPDLPKGYGGWQAIDATPQEESNNKMQCGPASLEAIRRGDVGLNYDCPFVFAEVNADMMHWGEDESSDWGFSRLKLNQFHIGRMVLTKKVGYDGDDENDENDREDVCALYKDPEGSAAERLAIHNAVRGTQRAQRYYAMRDNVSEDCVFVLEELESIKVGEDFKVKITVRNESDEPRTVLAALTARSIYYTGVNHTIIKKAEGQIKLGPKQEQELALTITYKEYWRKLIEHCLIKMYAICRVTETDQTWTEEDDFQVLKPSLDIQVPDVVKRGQPCDVVFSFTNPLDQELTKCSLSVDGSGLLRPRALELNK